jgi:hypothetical protein
MTNLATYPMTMSRAGVGSGAPQAGLEVEAEKPLPALKSRFVDVDGWGDYFLPCAVRKGVAAFLQAAGVRPKHSTGIDDLPSVGYGRLDEFGFWEFPLRVE